jgi:hypothetical protein
MELRLWGSANDMIPRELGDGRNAIERGCGSIYTIQDSTIFTDCQALLVSDSNELWKGFRERVASKLETKIPALDEDIKNGHPGY